MTISRDEIISRLTIMRPEIQTDFGIDIFGLIGSQARGDSHSDSDVDIAYERIAGRVVTLVHLGGVLNRVSEALNMSIDLVDWTALNPNYKDMMQKDLVRFYG